MEKLRNYQVPLSVAAAALVTASFVSHNQAAHDNTNNPSYQLTASTESFTTPEHDGKVASHLASQIAVSRTASLEQSTVSFSITGPNRYKKPDVSHLTNYWFGTAENFKIIAKYAKKTKRYYVIENAKILYVVGKASGMTNEEIGCADNIPVLESKFDHLLPNMGGDGGYGFGQATPGNKMAKYGPDYLHNIMTQMYWYIDYIGAGKGDDIRGHFGDACSAWDARHNKHMY